MKEYAFKMYIVETQSFDLLLKSDQFLFKSKCKLVDIIG